MKFLKHGIRHEGKYVRVFYSKSACINYPEGTITIYARDHDGHLPKELNPKNNSDGMTDYFETDAAYIVPSHPLYNEIAKHAR